MANTNISNNWIEDLTHSIGCCIEDVLGLKDDFGRLAEVWVRDGKRYLVWWNGVEYKEIKPNDLCDLYAYHYIDGAASAGTEFPNPKGSGFPYTLNMAFVAFGFHKKCRQNPVWKDRLDKCFWDRSYSRDKNHAEIRPISITTSPEQVIREEQIEWSGKLQKAQGRMIAIKIRYRVDVSLCEICDPNCDYAFFNIMYGAGDELVNISLNNPSVVLDAPVTLNLLDQNDSPVVATLNNLTGGVATYDGDGAGASIGNGFGVWKVTENTGWKTNNELCGDTNETLRFRVFELWQSASVLTDDKADGDTLIDYIFGGDGGPIGDGTATVDPVTNLSRNGLLLGNIPTATEPLTPTYDLYRLQSTRESGRLSGDVQAVMREGNLPDPPTLTNLTLITGLVTSHTGLSVDFLFTGAIQSDDPAPTDSVPGLGSFSIVVDGTSYPATAIPTPGVSPGIPIATFTHTFPGLGIYNVRVEMNTVLYPNAELYSQFQVEIK